MPISFLRSINKIRYETYISVNSLKFPALIMLTLCFFVAQMYFTPDTTYGNEMGIYCHEGKTRKMAELALYSCRNGENGGKSLFTARTDTTYAGWAVKFGSPPRIRGVYIFLQEA